MGAEVVAPTGGVRVSALSGHRPRPTLWVVVRNATDLRVSTRARRCEAALVVARIDRSVWGVRAFEWAMRFALASHSDVQVVHEGCIAELPLGPMVRKVLEQLPDVSVRFRQVDVSPAIALAEAGRDARMTVLGCADLAGQPSMSALSSAHGDIVVVRGLLSAIRGEHRWVAAAVDGDDDARVLMRAVELCRRRHARLRLVYVTGGAATVPVLKAGVALVRELDADLPVTVTAAVGHVPTFLLSAPSDVLVVDGRSSHGGALPAVTADAVNLAPCPVFVVGAR